MQVRVTHSRFQTRSYIISCLYFMLFFLLFKSPLSAQTAQIPAGSGTVEDPYLIANLNNLYWLSQTTSAWATGKYFKQTANIDASATLNWHDNAGFSPIGNSSGSFKGRYDGQSYTISSLYINRPTQTDIGLFGYLTGGKISNLGIVNADITGSGTMGILAGRSFDTLVNCYTSGTVTGTGPRVGGLVGLLGAVILYSHSSANVVVVAAGNITGSGGLVGTVNSGKIYFSYATGNVSGAALVGGLAGSFESNSFVEDCFARGNVTATSNFAGGLTGTNAGTTSNIFRSYSTGTVNAANYYGGLSGGSSTTNIHRTEKSFWDTQTSGIATSYGGYGKTTAEMKTNSTFTDSGWNFTNVWNRADSVNNGYPYIRSYQPSTAPTVGTTQASSLTPSSAVLHGIVNPGGDSTKAYFEYGLTTAYGTRTDTVNIGDGINAVPVSNSIADLLSNTTYHYRIVAYNSLGATQGSDSVFTTLAQPAPVVVTLDATEITRTTAKLNATVNPMGDSSWYYFEYTEGGNTVTTDTVYAGKDTSAVNVFMSVIGLTHSTRYTVKAIAFNSGGTTTGNNRAFVTISVTLTLTSPVGGEGWETGTTQPIIWTSAELDSLSIEYSPDNGTNWSMVAPSLPGASGSYQWNVPLTPTTFGKIRLSSKGITPQVVRTSAGVFVIGEGEWQALNTGTDNNLNGGEFTDPNNGTVVGDSGIIISTTNGGTDWDLEAVPSSGDLNGVSTPSNTTEVAVGDSNTILLSTNGGLDWLNIGASGGFNPQVVYNYQSVDFTDTLKGTVVGTSGKILRTTNRGTTWETQIGNTTETLQDVDMTDANWGTIVGRNGVILATSNGGANWVVQNSGTPQHLNSVYFVKNAGLHQIGFAVGDSGVILKTTNGGSTWTAQLSGTSKNLISVAFYNTQIGTAAGEGGVILRTTDGGTTWQPLVNAGNRNLAEVIIPRLGGPTFIAGSGGAVYKDTSGVVPVELTSFTSSVKNGEVTLQWTTATETNNAGFEVERASNKEWKKVGYVEGKGTTTQTSSYIYTQININTGTYLYRLKQIDFDGKSNYSPEIEVTVAAPLEFVLNQNYPNPFNPSTMIKYQLPEATEVTLKVYDIQGRQVAYLINQKQEAGYYSVNFEAGKLSSGVYFYRLEAGANRKIMKMLLLK